MPLLIQNGLLMTMTEQGCIRADLLIEHGRIARIEPHIDHGDLEDGCILDANGFVLVPGLIDLYISTYGESSQYIADLALSAGITTHLQRRDGSDSACLLADASGLHNTDVIHTKPSAYTDERLHTLLHRSSGRVICSIRSQDECRRVLELASGAKTSPILAGLIGCHDAADQIAGSGCPVIIGVRRNSSSPWALAARLDALGATVAISSCYPAAQLKLLSVCAGLCMRDGMPAERAVCSITSTPARMLGLNDRGRLAPGLRADITVFDGNPLLLATSHVMTIAGGRILRKA